MDEKEKTQKEHTISIEKEALQEIGDMKQGNEDLVEEKRRMFNMLDTINGDFDVFGNPTR